MSRVLSFSPARGRTLLAAALVGVVLAGSALAHDFGVQGKVWAIIEVDMREILLGDVAKHDWDKVNSQLKEAAGKYFDNLPKRFAPGVSQTKTRWIDPSFVLDNDIYAPVKNAQGDYEWKVLYPKGSRANPLSVQRPYNAMLFFDGNVKEQVAFVTEALNRHPGKLLPVELTGANPKDLSDKLSTPIFSATPEMVARFNITESPSLLYPGEKAHALELGLTTFSQPFSQVALDNTWPEGLKSTQGAPIR
jgi:conjugal transfer pilus assembly protein TraW